MTLIVPALNHRAHTPNCFLTRRSRGVLTHSLCVVGSLGIFTMMLSAARTASKTLGRIGVSAAKATRSPKAGVLGRRAAPSAALSTSPAATSGFADLGLPHK